MTNQSVKRFELEAINLPVWQTFLALLLGLLVGAIGAYVPFFEELLSLADLTGALWLRSLQMTIIPLVASLLVLGIAQMAAAAKAGPAAISMLTIMGVILVLSGVMAAFFMPLLLAIFPMPSSASSLLLAGEAGEQVLPQISDFFLSLIAPNIVAAAAETAMLPLTIFFTLFAIAISQLPKEQREMLTGFFHALANAMLTIIGWVLWVAPLGVFSLALGVAAKSGGGAFLALGHYILLVSGTGALVLLLAYGLSAFATRRVPFGFAKAILPAQSVAISTQSSLASLPAMLASARALGLKNQNADFVLPLAVAIFRATSPAMNVAVVIYVAHLAGVALHPGAILAGIGVALIISVGSVSLPGSISFVVSIGPIALAMGVPLEPLALLVAVEMLPDIMRTLGNVSMNVAVTQWVEKRTQK